MGNRLRRLAALAALTGSFAAAAADPPAGTVESFSPTGSHKDVRQVQARFSLPMVAFGDPRLTDPFDVDCAAAGAGRWADPRNWVYDFEEDLPAGLACRFTLKPGARTLEGGPIAGQRAFRFDTGGPAIRRSFPAAGWEAIDEDQVFLLRLDAPAEPATIAMRAYCVVDGLQERIPVEVLTGAEREAMLAQRKSLGYAYYRLLWKSGEETGARVRDRALETSESRITVLRCRRHLPPDTEVRLVWGAGIASTSGIETAQDQWLAFRVRPAFTVRVECSRANADAGCLPMLPIRVVFGAPVPTDAARAIRLRFSDGTEASPAPPAGASPPVLEQVSFDGPHPPLQSVKVILPQRLHDDAGRTPVNADRYPLPVEIDDYPPLAKFAGEFGILEAAEGGVLPVTLRNVESPLPARRHAVIGSQLRVAGSAESIASWLRRVAEANEPRGQWVYDEKTRERSWQESTGDKSVFDDAKEDGIESFTIAKAEGTRPAEVVGIPLGRPGLYVVEAASERLGASVFARQATRYVSTAALVTDLSVHFKWGRERSIVWVTRLSDGKPVPGADVVVTEYCDGSTRWSGRTGEDGIATIATTLGEPHGNDDCRYSLSRPLLAVATLGEDMAFTPSFWNEGIEPHAFGLPVGSAYEASVTHTVFDRPLFRAGETVSMKHFIRRRQLDGIGLPAQAAGQRRVEIRHEGSGQSWKFDVAFGPDGTADQAWKIPAEAKLGEYTVYVSDRLENREVRRESGAFKVEQYRLPLMRAIVQGPPRPLARPREVQLDLHVSHLSGGGAGDLPVRLRTTVEPVQQSVAGYQDYAFGGAPVVTGIQNRPGHAYDFDPEAESPDGPASATRLLPLTLDGQGTARVTIGELPAIDAAARLVAELEYPDPNGEMLTATGTVQLVPSAVQLGIRREGWVASEKQMRFQVVALDLDGKPLARQKIEVSLYRTTTYSYRKRLIGGFYAYETLRESALLPAACRGFTNRQGLLPCEVAPGVSGEISVRAESRDRAGNLAGATAPIWVAGEDDWWFGGTQGDRMDLLPEKKEYEAGETARLQVRMPFRRATALVTVEREGVISSFVTTLRGREPVVRLPVGQSWAPNVFVSVLAVRGRTATGRRSAAEAGTVTALVDLNKPSYRLGTAALRVGWQPHRLDVVVEPAATTWRVRETAVVRVRVASADGSPLPEGAEIAFAAVDEALLELALNPSWALLDAMMGERGLSVWTSTAQMQVVGKRHYGRKAVPHGGGGGRDRARELFDSLLLWRARAPLDANGEAVLDVPLNDSLSAFRLVAVAHAGPRLFGTGSASIHTTQDLMLLSGLPPLMREGDRYDARFTVRNTTSAPMTVEVIPRLEPAGADALEPARTTVGAGQSADLSWSVRVPVGHADLRWDVSARDVSGPASDRVRVTQSVVPALPVRTYQSTIAQLAAPFSLAVERPAAAIPGRGGIEVTLRSRLGDGLDGVRAYMSDYRYTCIEQLLSRAVALRSSADWDALMQRLPAYVDDDGLLRYFPVEWLDGDDALTAYVLAIADEAGYGIPEATRSRLVTGLAAFADGRITRRSALPTADLAIRKLAAIEAISRYGAARAAMLDSLAIEPTLWPTSAVLDWLSVLRRVSDVRDREPRARAAEGILRSRLNFQGTTLGFSTERSDALWWLMISTDQNAARMLIAVLDRPDWREDVPRLVRGLLGRQQYGHWSTTPANAWGVLAMEKFSAAFEATPVTGRTALDYAGERRELAWQPKTQDLGTSLPWKQGKQALRVEHAGKGRPWLMLRSQAAMPLTQPLSTGYRVSRSVTAVHQQTPGRWTRGDVMRVSLTIDAQSDMTWVVVDDPVPAGATVLGNGLGGQSGLMQRGERETGWAWPAFVERRFDAWRAYYHFIPKGQFTAEYTVRLNNPGEFLLPATRVEAMYAPEMLGELPNDPVVVAGDR
jgi:uncharacterized protein YfaS (alpha-2-macroglobulin family)